MKVHIHIISEKIINSPPIIWYGIWRSQKELEEGCLPIALFVSERAADEYGKHFLIDYAWISHQVTL